MNLENSMTRESGDPLVLQHAILLQATKAAFQVLELGLKNYNKKCDDRTTPSDKLWVTVPALQNAHNILKDVLPSD